LRKGCRAAIDFAAPPRHNIPELFSGDIMKKIHASAAEALDGLLFDGMTIAAGGLACAAFLSC